MLLEVIVQTVEEAIEAERLGADRLELVSGIGEGGLTPSYGTIKQVLKSVSIPVQIMIRPHSYHFHYSSSDLDTMYEDVNNIISLGGTGIVFGALHKDNTINEEALKNIIQLSPELDITFHRAFDEVSSQEAAYLILNRFKQNVRRILTSGGKANCEDGKNSLKRLVDLSDRLQGPKILPGSGLTSTNIEWIHQAVGAEQYHFGKSLRTDQSFAKGFDKLAFDKIIKFKSSQ
ncbi:copper homeostasis protein CutC [Ornithinibacillus bavariensis]|uniref:copper homeostasis protein CutC n=1 Tax=Ornithinibacillus bavariensis TaxID=545502 RepID=UPI000EDED23B|nr:copper homeostasis protein CutC [Ornithinibacillus sp.]